MARRRKAPPPPDWEEHRDAVVNGRHLSPGSEVSIRGERGRFRFVKRVVRPERGVEWLDFWGGPKHAPQLRSFYPDRVKTVHRIAQTPEALLAARRKKNAE